VRSLKSLSVVAVLALAPSAVFAQSGSSATDHSLVVGRIGLGYFGALSAPSEGTVGASQTVQMLGARYWMSEGMGVDVALGVNMGSGSTTVNNGNTTTTVNTPGAFGFALMAGVPFNLFSAKHYSFIARPELSFARGSLSSADDSRSGMNLRFGGSGGASVQFGFIGIPQLAIDALVGAHFAISSGSTAVTAGGTTTTRASRRSASRRAPARSPGESSRAT
jgi:hypothetical protein